MQPELASHCGKYGTKVRMKKGKKSNRPNKKYTEIMKIPFLIKGFQLNFSFRIRIQNLTFAISHLGYNNFINKQNEHLNKSKNINATHALKCANYIDILYVSRPMTMEALFFSILFHSEKSFRNKFLFTHKKNAACLYFCVSFSAFI